MKILIAGPIGSGKTTQAEILSNELTIPLIDSGNMLRQLAQTETKDGIKIKQILEIGALVPDNITARLVKSRIAKEDTRDGFIMDGYPRRLSQIQEFDPKFDQVFYINISDEEVKKRLLKRGRADDTPEVIAKRLAVYHQETEPVLDYYQTQGILKRINGQGSIEETAQKIKASLHGQ